MGEQQSIMGATPQPDQVITFKDAKLLFIEMLDIYEEKKVQPRHAAHIAAQKATDDKVSKLLSIVDRSTGWRDAVKTFLAAVGFVATVLGVWKVFH